MRVAWAGLGAPLDLSVSVLSIKFITDMEPPPRRHRRIQDDLVLFWKN